ncbi:MAG: ABC transporter permease subunit [Elusimicrobiota bacterium]|nr:ABC transporter permease subunit [Elusimicrobiota bacterium]
MRITYIPIIIKKELKLYFNSPIAYIVIVIFLIISGFFYSRPLFVQNFATLRYYFELLPLFLLFFVPAVTMRIYSEEYKTGTIEIMFTLPFNKLEILLGKYLASTLVILLAMALTLLYPFSLIFLGRLDIGATIAGYLGIVFLCLFYTSVGVFSSSFTKNQVVSFIVTFFILFIFFILGKISMFIPAAISYAGIDLHYENFIRGVVDFRSVVFFISLSVLFLYLTYLSTSKEK